MGEKRTLSVKVKDSSSHLERQIEGEIWQAGIERLSATAETPLAVSIEVERAFVGNPGC